MGKNIKEKIKLDDIEQKTKKTKKIAKKAMDEYKAFAIKGNIMDLALGVVIGGAFTNIVNSLVTNIITPILGYFTSKVDLNNLFIALNGKNYPNLETAKASGAVVLTYGALLNSIVNFLIITLILFIVFKYINKLNKRNDISEDVVKQETTKKCPYCLSVIPKEATKCAFCTSDLNNLKESENININNVTNTEDIKN